MARRLDFDEANARLGGPRAVLERHGIRTIGNSAACPFHEDREPSLSLFTGVDHKERWYCHGCLRRGDAVDLEALLTDTSPGAVARSVL
jgi:hypothetical protein